MNKIKANILTTELQAPVYEQLSDSETVNIVGGSPSPSVNISPSKDGSYVVTASVPTGNGGDVYFAVAPNYQSIWPLVALELKWLKSEVAYVKSHPSKGYD